MGCGPIVVKANKSCPFGVGNNVLVMRARECVFVCVWGGGGGGHTQFPSKF